MKVEKTTNEGRKSNRGGISIVSIINTTMEIIKILIP